MKPADNDDPKGLIRESYRIDGITEAECRSILVDWALSHDAALDQRAALSRLCEFHGPQAPDHPMTRLLEAAAAALPGAPARRGGRAGRQARMG